VKKTLGSSRSTSGAEGSRMWPFSSKCLKNRSRIVALSMSLLLRSRLEAGAAPPWTRVE